MKQSQGRPWKWYRLAHVCRKWRHVIATSPRRLDLRILCEHGAPIGSILDSWPTLPLVAKFNTGWNSKHIFENVMDALHHPDTGWRSKHIPENIMVALHHPDRLCEIDLHVTTFMLTSFVKVTQRPSQVLEKIRIIIKDPIIHTGPPILIRNAFLGGSAPHLREIKLDGIAFPFPSIQQVLLSTRNLVELHLAKIPNDAYFSPNDLVTSLSTLARLKRLTVDFHSPASSPPPSTICSPSQRTTLPCLTFFKFHGASGYLEEFVAQIDLPAHCQITIRLFNDIFFEIPQFYKLVPRLNVLWLPAGVIVTHNVHFVSVLIYQGRLGRQSENGIILETSCRRLDWQLSFVTQIFGQLSSLLSNVHSLDIQSGDEMPTGEEDVDPTQWLELFRPFTRVTEVYLLAKHLIPPIMQVLIADTVAGVLPELTSLHLAGYYDLRKDFPSAKDAATQFVARRRLFGRTVTLSA